MKRLPFTEETEDDYVCVVDSKETPEEVLESVDRRLELMGYEVVIYETHDNSIVFNIALRSES